MDQLKKLRIENARLGRVMRMEWQHDRDCEYVVHDGPAPCTCIAAEIAKNPPSREQIEAAIAVRHKEIEWNIRRLANLILDDEDRQQTEDLIMDLREERESLKRCLNVA